MHRHRHGVATPGKLLYYCIILFSAVCCLRRLVDLAVVVSTQATLKIPTSLYCVTELLTVVRLVQLLQVY